MHIRQAAHEAGRKVGQAAQQNAPHAAQCLNIGICSMRHALAAKELGHDGELMRRQARQRDQGMAWKLAFAHWRQMVTGEAYQRFKPVPPAWLRGGFGEFMARMCQREGLPVAAGRCLVEIETAGWQRQREVMRLSIARHAFRRALEIWLVLDLACYLEKRGYAVDLGVFCRRELTPRNLLISARRSA